MSNANDKSILLETLKSFQLDGDVISCEPYGEGHINSTQLVVCTSGKRYIFQKISTRAFKDVPALMENIDLVTSYLRREASDPRTVLTLVYATGGKAYVHNEHGYWRVYDFVEDSLCLQKAESDADFYESAVAFGRFQQQRHFRRPHARPPRPASVRTCRHFSSSALTANGTAARACGSPRSS